jgi:DNA topoisomerase VI subunit B
VKDLILEASDDLVTRLARERDPVRAVVELVWNTIDGEADAVRVLLRRTDMEAIDAVIVEDDGHGITSDEVEWTFGRIGGSWKALSSTSKNGKRSLHGKLGEGRLRAFALGSRVTWVSESINTAGVHETVTIEGDRDSGHVLHWDAQPSTKSKTGTRVTALNEHERSLNVLASDVALPTLRAHFGPGAGDAVRHPAHRSFRTVSMMMRNDGS